MLELRDMVRSADAVRSMLARRIASTQSAYGALVAHLRDEFLQRAEERCHTQWAERFRVDTPSAPGDLDRAA